MDRSAGIPSHSGLPRRDRRGRGSLRPPCPGGSEGGTGLRLFLAGTGLPAAEGQAAGTIRVTRGEAGRSRGGNLPPRQRRPRSGGAQGGPASLESGMGSGRPSLHVPPDPRSAEAGFAGAGTRGTIVVSPALG